MKWFITTGLPSSRNYAQLKSSFHTNIRNFSYSNRIAHDWNSLPQHFFKVTLVNTFKTGLLVDICTIGEYI